MLVYLLKSDACTVLEILFLIINYFFLREKKKKWLPNNGKCDSTIKTWPIEAKTRRAVLTSSCSGYTGTGTCSWCHSCGSGSPSGARDEPAWLYGHKASRTARARHERRLSATWQRDTARGPACPVDDLSEETRVYRQASEAGECFKTVKTSTCRVAHFVGQLDAGVSCPSAALLARDAIPRCLTHLLVPGDRHVRGKLRSGNSYLKK